MGNLSGLQNQNGYLLRVLNKYPYFVTLLSVFAVAAFKFASSLAYPLEIPFLLFLAAVAVSAWHGGGRQGLLATLLVSAASLTLFAPQFNSDFYYQFLLFLVDCLIVVFVCARLRWANLRLIQTIQNMIDMQRNLSKSQSRFNRIFDSDMIGMMILDKSGRVLEANDVFLKIIGRTKLEVAEGQVNWDTITPPEFLTASREAREEFARKGSISKFEKAYMRPDGTRVPVLMGATKLDDDLSIAYILDISDSKRVEGAVAVLNSELEERVKNRTAELTEANSILAQRTERLRQSQMFLDSVFENIPNMIFVKDAKTLKFVRFNKAGEELLGYKREDLIGKSDYDFFPVAQAEFFIRKDRAVLESNDVVDIPEEPIRSKSGERILHTKKIPILDSDGKPLYLLGISEDITEKKIAEKQQIQLIQEQEARSQAEKRAEHLRFMAEAKSSLSESLCVDAMLTAFARVAITNIADWCIIELIDNDSSSTQRPVVMNSDFETASKVELALAEKSQLMSVEFKDGKGKILAHEYFTDLPTPLDTIHSGMAVPLISYGRAQGVMYFLNHSREKTFTPLDLASIQDLANRASLAIQNARLFAQANEASRAKSSFLANMSHEIRTPLGAMLGFAQLALDETLSLKQAEYIRTVVKNGQQLLGIVDEILDLSKVESERILIEKIPFSLHRLLNEVHQTLKIKAEQKDLELIFTTHHLTEDKYISDPTRIRQILLNLIGNAIKFTSHGNVELIVHSLPALKNEKATVIKFIVRDTGIGISKSEEALLFQPFSQADSSMTRKFGGTGLGLFLAKRLATLLGGDVILNSSECGKGSEFIALVEVENSSHPNAIVQKDLETHPLIGSAKSRVLIVDDSPDNRILVRHYLTKLGIQSDFAENGRIAVEKASSSFYDIVLMDIQMPEMDGFQALRELKQRKYGRPVIALTAHAMKGDRERCLAEGFDEYLCKPLSREALSETLHRFI